jgi:hypothetical protein
VTHKHTPRTLDDGGPQDASGWADHVGGQREESRSLRHRHAEGKVEDISSSPNFHPADVKPPAPMGSMGEDIQPIADPDAQAKLIHPPEIEVGTRRAGQMAGMQGELVGDRRELRNVGDPAAAAQDSIAIPEAADTGDARMSRTNPLNDVRGTGRVGVSQDDMHSRPERWARFEDLLRRNHVDIESKCPQCAPAKERKRA